MTCLQIIDQFIVDNFNFLAVPEASLCEQITEINIIETFFYEFLIRVQEEKENE